MQQFCTVGSVRGAAGNRRPYRDPDYFLQTTVVPYKSLAGTNAFSASTALGLIDHSLVSVRLKLQLCHCDKAQDRPCRD